MLSPYKQRSAEATAAAALLRAVALKRDVGAARGEAAYCRADAKQAASAGVQHGRGATLCHRHGSGAAVGCSAGEHTPVVTVTAAAV